MSLLDAPQPKSAAEVAAQTIRDNVPAIYRELIRNHNNLMGAFSSTDVEVMQAVANALSNEASQAYGLRQALKTFILGVNPKETGLVEFPEGITITPNQDGTVTIS